MFFVLQQHVLGPQHGIHFVVISPVGELLSDVVSVGGAFGIIISVGDELILEGFDFFGVSRRELEP